MAVLAATTCWGLGGVLGKAIGASGLVVSFYRLWMGAFVLTAVLLVTRRRLTWDVVKRSWLGGVCFGLNVALYFSAVHLTSIANVAIIGSLTPVIVFPIAVKWMGEQVTRRALVCSALAIAGVVVVVIAGGSSGQPFDGRRPARRAQPGLVGRVLPRDQARPRVESARSSTSPR